MARRRVREMKIVVGIDGSDNGAAALRWAIAEARAHHAELHAVHAYETPFHLVGMGEPTPITVDADAVKEAAKALLNDVVDTVAGGDTGVVIHRELGEGPPASVLRQAAGDADLLVVGTRGRGGFTELLLGSVSSQVTHHAPCPVVVVPVPST